MRNNPPTLEQAMNYADMMEACASYIAVKNPTVKEPSKVFEIMSPLFQHAKQESLFIIMLDTKSKIIGAPRELFRGLLDSCPTHAREVFRQAIRDCAAALIIVHNHPSGDPTPSREDIEATRRLVEAGRIIGIPLFDHVILGNRFSPEDCAYISLRERNLVSFASSLHAKD